MVHLSPHVSMHAVPFKHRSEQSMEQM